MNKGKRIAGIFLSPSEVFQDLRGNSDWVLPISISLLISLITMYILLPSVIIPNQIEQIRNYPGISIEQKNAMIVGTKGLMPYITNTVTIILITFITYLVLAGLVMLISFVFDGEGVGFKSVFSAVCYISLIGSLGTIFIGIIMYTQQIVNTGLHLGLLFPNLDGFIGKIITGINFFGLWQALLLVILLRIFYNYKAVKAYIIIFILYLIWKIVIALSPFPMV